MADDQQRKAVKIGVHLGGGPPPGYRWNIRILDQAYAEAMHFLNGDQYEHLARQFQELARQDDATHSQIIDIRPIEDFFELRDKGGILRNINTRVFYFVHTPTRTIAILGAIKKENNGQTPAGDKITMRRRKRQCLVLFDAGP